MPTKTPSRECKWCGKGLLEPRVNQIYCNKICRREHKHAQKQRNNKPKPLTTNCKECNEVFETDNPDKEFCSSICQQGWNNFWKSRGPAIAKALDAWRVKREKGSFTKVCQAYSAARKAHKQRREEKKS